MPAERFASNSGHAPKLPYVIDFGENSRKIIGQPISWIVKKVLGFTLSLGLLPLGCTRLTGRDAVTKIHPGETSLAEALRVLDEPLRITEVHDRTGVQLLHWQEHTLQVENKLVTAVFRDPSETEKSLLYWRHSYRGQEQVLTRGGAPEELQLLIPDEGIAVVFDEDRDEVIKVVRYETP